MHPGVLLRETRHDSSTCGSPSLPCAPLSCGCVLMVRDLCGRVTAQRCESSRSVKNTGGGRGEGEGVLLSARLRRSEVEHVKRSSASRISTCEAKVAWTGPDCEHRCFTHTSSKVDNDVESLDLLESRLPARDKTVLTRHVKKDSTVPVPSLAPSLCKLTRSNDSTCFKLFTVNFELPTSSLFLDTYKSPLEGVTP